MKISEKKYEELKRIPIEELETMNAGLLNTLLLEIFERRSKEITPKEVFEQYRDRYEFFCPSKTDLRTINDYNKIFLDCLPEKYDAIELSPINPFGGNSSFTNLSQKNILTSIKNSEVCSDATTALTLEACKRRKERIKNPNLIMEDVNLATIKKVLRMQQFDKEKGYLQHFGQFAAITAGRKQENFEYDKIKEHIEIWVKLFQELKGNDFTLGEINVGICHIDIIEHFIKQGFVDRQVVNKNSFNDFKLFKETGINIPDKIVDYEEFTDNQKRVYCLSYVKKHIEKITKMIEELKQEFPEVNFYVEMDRKGGLGYYVGSCFHIYSKENDYYVPLCDRGIPDWNKQLLQDRKETSVVSGIGSELVLNLYKRKV